MAPDGEKDSGPLGEFDAKRGGRHRRKGEKVKPNLAPFILRFDE